MSKKEENNIEKLAVLAEVKGKVYQLVVNEKTQNSILVLIERMEGSIKALEDPLEDISFKKT
jgi:hypothetical protein